MSIPGLHHILKAISPIYFGSCRERADTTVGLLDARDQIGHIGHMRKTSLANAKTHLSRLVDLAEHRGQRTLILRHGKPAAVIAPAEMHTASAAPLTTMEAKDLLDRIARCAPPSESIEEALGRRRHEPAK